MALKPATQLASYTEQFNRELVIPQLINMDWRPDYQNGKGATTDIQTFQSGITGKGSDIGEETARMLTSNHTPATLEQHYAAVAVTSIDQTTLVEDFEKAIAPTIASHVLDIEREFEKVLSGAVSSVHIASEDNLPEFVARVIGQIKNNTLKSPINVVSNPEIVNVMAAKLLDKLLPPNKSQEAFGGKIRGWMGGSSEIGESLAIESFTTGTVEPVLTVTAPTGATKSLTIAATTQAYPAGTLSVNLGKIAYDPIKKATGKDLIVTNAEDMAVGATSFPLGFTLEVKFTCSAYPTSGDYPTVEQSDTTYGKLYVFNKIAIAGRGGVLGGHADGKLTYTPKVGNNISVRRWEFSNGNKDIESVRFDTLIAAAAVYPVGVHKILIPM